MTKKIFVLSLVVFFVFGMFIEAHAHGDGYTGCEKDPVYERDFTAAPNVYLNLRQRACMADSPVLKVLPPNVEVRVIAETDGWYKVKDSDGAIGWAGAMLMKKTSNDSSNGKIIKNGYNVEVKKADKEVAESEKQKLRERVKGYILLQVESKGEAWYVNPDDEKRYYMKDGKTAFEMMRSFGLGISNANLSKLKAGNSLLVNRLKGRIVLQVQDKGQAYYVSPRDGSVHYMKNGPEAYKIMKNLSLGINNKNLNKIVKKNKIEKIKKANKKSEEKSSCTGNCSITLNGNKTAEGKVVLTWVLNDMISPKGFKVVKSTEENPVYPGNTYHYLSDPDTRTDTWSNLTEGNTYYFRVCEYLGGSCGVYSNNLMIDY